MDQPVHSAQQRSQPTRPPLSALLSRLRTVLEAQADAVGADDFTSLERFSAEREQLGRALDGYGPADFQASDRPLLEQIGALDQRLLEMTRSSLEQTNHGLRDVHRGRIALTEYRRRGQTLIRNLAYLDQDR
jgi:hypothetical protein